MTEFCHIAPTSLLDEFAKGRRSHLLLAHLVETDQAYRDWYLKNRIKKDIYSFEPRQVYILDNSAFEMYKQNKPMYDSAKLIAMGKEIDADYIVMSDYPGEPGQKTIDAALELAPKFLANGFGTFFVPQSKIGDLDDLLKSYQWAVGPVGKRFVDYIGVSILGVPNAYGVEKGNRLQRFMARYSFMRLLHKQGILDKAQENGQKIHFLGMVDGPKEIQLVEPFLKYIDTWDSSAAVWTGINGIKFDDSPTGLISGKYEKEVDFSFSFEQTVHKSPIGQIASYLGGSAITTIDATAPDTTEARIQLAHSNVRVIDNLLEQRNYVTGLRE